jgi:ferric-dicitrate binding protein FerR (iron transport regulator)
MTELRIAEPLWTEDRARAALEGVWRKRRARRMVRGGALLFVLMFGAWRALFDNSLVRYGDGSTAHLLSEQSVLARDSASAELMVSRLESGGARFSVVKNPARRFRVESAGVTVEVLGTQFTVENQGAHARVAVEEGRVRVSWRGGERILSTGDAGVFPPQDKDGDEVSSLFHEADSLRAQGKNAEAVAPLERIVDQYPRDPRAPLAAFTLGKLLNDPRWFQKVIELDPHGALVNDAKAHLR